MSKFKGTAAAIITPFDKNNNVDYKALERVINHGIDGGLDYIVSLGTTGESATLSYEERKDVVTATKNIIDKKVPLVVGIGGNNTNTVINTIEKGDFEAVDAILSVSPYYNKPSQEGIYQHYKAISECSPVDIILYNVPGRTSSNIDAETTIRLAKNCKNIVAIKEASANFSQIMEIITNKPKNFTVLSGDDDLTLPLISLGMEGVISVTAQAFPKLYSQMVDAARNKHMDLARNLHYKLLPFMNAIFLDGNPGGIKSALANKGLIENQLRLPLVPVQEEVDDIIRDIVEELG